MIKRITLATLVAVLLLACTTAPATAPATTPKNAVTVLIDSRPDHSELIVDGKFIGTTPMSFRMTPGDHRIEIRREDFETWSRELTVYADNPARVTAMLKKQVK